MPSTGREISIHTRLSYDGLRKLDAIAESRKISRAAIAREALITYLENHQALLTADRDNQLDQRLRRMENRLAGLLARTAIDVGVIYTLIWRNLPGDRDAILTNAYNQAVARLSKKLRGVDGEVKELIRNEISGEAQLHQRTEMQGKG